MLKQNNVNSQNLNICLSNNYVCLKISSENSNDSFFSNFILEKKIKTEFLSDFLDKILVDKMNFLALFPMIYLTKIIKKNI